MAFVFLLKHKSIAENDEKKESSVAPIINTEMKADLPQINFHFEALFGFKITIWSLAEQLPMPMQLFSQLHVVVNL